MSFCEWYCCIIHSCISSFRGKLFQISGSINTKLGILLAKINFSLGIHHSMISYPRLPSIRQSIYVWFCICSSCWQYVSDFQYHDCHGLNAGRSVNSLKQQRHSGILVARYPRIYKEIFICYPDTNLKAKPNRNTTSLPTTSLPCSCWRYHDLHCVTNILLKAGIALPRSPRRVTKIFGIFCTSIYCNFVKFYYRFGYHIETITNDRPIHSVKHVKHNAKE